MIIRLKARRNMAAKLAAALLCAVMLAGMVGVSALAVEADDSRRLVDVYCSQSAKDALGYDQLQDLVELIVTSIEPQAVNLLIERFPCFKEAAADDALGREIGLYIYYKTGDQDGIEEHEEVESNAYAYVNGYSKLEAGKSVFKYIICMDAGTLSTPDDADNPVLDLDGQARIQLDTTFCHELFHAFMEDYNRVGMSGFTDFVSCTSDPKGLLTDEEVDMLCEETRFPNWFMEGLAGCVGNIYPADLKMFREYHLDPDTRQYLDTCTTDQLCQVYANPGYGEETGEVWYDLEAVSADKPDDQVIMATYVSGYMACLYLADLGYRHQEGSGAVSFDPNGDVASISSEKLREGLSAILSRLHRGDTLDEVIRDISGGAYRDTADFEARFIKGSYSEVTRQYSGDPESLSFCVGYLNYMSRLDDLDPDTHPAGSMLMDDFASTQPTPLEKDATATSDFYRIVEGNTLVPSTIPDETVKDGGTSYSGRDSFETVVEQFKAKNRP